MTELVDLVEGLKREVAVPGTFSRVYRNTTDRDLEGSLMDAFANIKLDGFFSGYELDVDAATVAPDLPLSAQALVKIYAAERIMTAQIANLKSRAVYEAGPARYETEQAASVLVQLLKGIQERKRHVLELANGVDRSGLHTRDMYAERVLGVEY